MRVEKLRTKNCLEYICLVLVFLLILTNAFFHNDSPVAVVSSICGITYTFLAGKGKPFCYLFGICGSFFYSYLALQNSLWGNLVLYVCYYIPMQILGYFRWNNNLKENSDEIIKIKLPQKELYALITISIFFIIGSIVLLYHFSDKHPILDSITTILSLGGMYLTVRRALEQWIFWVIVNALSFMMWIFVILSGTRVYSTAIMWGVYFILAIYFYISWVKEINSNKKVT